MQATDIIRMYRLYYTSDTYMQRPCTVYRSVVYQEVQHNCHSALLQRSNSVLDPAHPFADDAPKLSFDLNLLLRRSHAERCSG